MVPPTPGPLAAVAILHADMGRVIAYGCLVSIIASFFGWLYALAVGPHLESPPAPEFVGQSFVERGRESDLPTTFWAFAPILIPLTLIAAQSSASVMFPKDHFVNRAMLYLGWPVVALTIGVLVAYRSTSKDQARARAGEWVENALRTSEPPRSTFSATGRSFRSSRARKTVAMPPAPIWRSSVNRGVSAARTAGGRSRSESTSRDKRPSRRSAIQRRTSADDAAVHFGAVSPFVP
jgi:hypothetical protein